MSTLERSIVIAAPVASVWTVLEDVSLLPEFSPSTTAVDVDDVLDGTDETTASARRRWVELTSFARVLSAEPGEVGRVIAAAATDRHPHPVYRVGFASRLGPLSRVVPTQVDDAITAWLFGLQRV